MKTRRQAIRAGFSLVEVALALLVVSVGIMAAFGMFPGGLDAGRASLNETRASMFAEETFNSFRGLAQSPDRTWGNFTAATPAAPGLGLWVNPEQLAARANGDIHRNRYVPAGDSSLGPQYALRYRLVASDGEGGRVRRLRLWVWPEEFGSTADEDAYYFYTEIYRFEGP